MPRNRRSLERQPLGLDEIMIVNPGMARLRLQPIARLSDPYRRRRGPALFLGDDGVVYALHGSDEPLQRGDLLLGADGDISRVTEPEADDLPEDDLFEVERELTYVYESVYPLPVRWRPARGHRGGRRRR